MWVWQSQAPAGTSKFTGVAGCDAFASAVRSGMATPAAMEASRRSRGLSMGRLLCSAFSVLFGGGGIRARHGGGIACRARGKEGDDRACERTGGQEIQPGFKAVGGVLDPADDEGAEIAAKIARGIDQCDRACRGRA